MDSPERKNHDTRKSALRVSRGIHGRSEDKLEEVRRMGSRDVVPKVQKHAPGE